MAAESTIKPYIGGLVEVDVVEDDFLGVYQPTHEALVTANAIMEAAYQARAINAVDAVMKQHRKRFIRGVEDQAVVEKLLDEVWKDLRTACGLPAEFEYDSESRP